MKLSTLNAWRRVYLAEAALAMALTLAARSPVRGKEPAAAEPLAVRAIDGTLALGAGLWLLHDLAHGRWKAATGDLVALAGSGHNARWGRRTSTPIRLGAGLLILGGTVYAAWPPERPPSPFIWSRAATRGTS